MEYRIERLDAFTVVGQETKLTKFQKENVKLCKMFWKQFNHHIKKAYLHQSENWIKYAFMERKDDILVYYCAIPKKIVVPKEFSVKEIPPLQYLVVHHIGDMDKIYDTYHTVYKEIVPNSGYSLNQEYFLHFEKYDYRFYWNATNSVIEIWIPIKGEIN